MAAVAVQRAKAFLVVQTLWAEKIQSTTKKFSQQPMPDR
jgi:hypothetical protein